MTDYDRGRWEVLLDASNAEWGKQCYFLQDNGEIYSRETEKLMTLDQAIEEFVLRLHDF